MKNDHRSKFSNYLINQLGHTGYTNILLWLQGFQVKIVNVSSLCCLAIPKRDLHTKRTTPNIEIQPQNVRAMLEYRYIKRGLLMKNISSSHP